MSDVSDGRGNGSKGGGETLAGGTVELIEIQEEMERSFLEYSMSVIVARALPDVRDGLKPVQRRILYGMYDTGLRPDRPHIKCAKVTGDVMGRFHPHGNLAIYDALVRMVQDFSLRHPLIDGHGNFGSPDPATGPAAERYTECRLAALALQLMAGIDEETVPFVPNYDGSDTEPSVLPARYPNLLVNGSEGIAVGMATKIPPHNLVETVDAAIFMIDHPDASADQLLEHVKGPDFPTGGLILGRSGIMDAYRTGKGSIRVRGVAEIETARGGGERIVVSEIPYQTSVEGIARRIAELVNNRELEGIRGIQDDSAGRKTRLVIDLKRDANANVVLNNLYKHTPLQTTYAVNMLALVDGIPRTLTLPRMVGEYVAHQVDVVTKRSEFRLRRARERAHIVEGLLRAIDQLDAVIAVIRGSEDRPAARESLVASPFNFSEVQANHILDMTLGRLTRLGRSELEGELAELRQKVSELEAILGDPARLRQVIKEELAEVKAAFGQPRRTRITYDPGDLEAEDLIDDEELVVTVTEAGYAKTTQTGTFRTQARGGRGVQGAQVKAEDLVRHVIHTTAHAYMLFFSNLGRVYRLKAHEIPLRERTARGTALVNLIPLAAGETIQAVIGTREYGDGHYLTFVTKLGQVKRTVLSEYDKSRREGFIALVLREGDELVKVVETTGEDDLLVLTRQGMTIRFSEQEVRAMARNAAGVRGITLRSGDEVVSADVTHDDRDIVIVTEAGYGKRTRLSHFHRQGRGGQGVRGMRLTGRRGAVVGGFMVNADDELLVISSSGVAIRTEVRQISSQGRDATGVRIMNLDPGQTVVAVTPVASGEA
jgi:DNA gyrase subunit A